MDTRAALWALCATAALLAGMAQAGELLPPPNEATAEKAIDKVDEATRRAYNDALADFDSLQKLAPSDVEFAVARCRFIQNYADDESGAWLAGAAEELESCSQQLQERWPKAPQVQLFELEQMWGAEAAQRGEALIKWRWGALLRVG